MTSGAEERAGRGMVVEVEVGERRLEVEEVGDAMDGGEQSDEMDIVDMGE